MNVARETSGVDERDDEVASGHVWRPWVRFCYVPLSPLDSLHLQVPRGAVHNYVRHLIVVVLAVLCCREGHLLIHERPARPSEASFQEGDASGFQFVRVVAKSLSSSAGSLLVKLVAEAILGTRRVGQVVRPQPAVDVAAGVRSTRENLAFAVELQDRPGPAVGLLIQEVTRVVGSREHAFRAIADGGAIGGEVEAPVTGTYTRLVHVMTHLVCLHVHEVVGT